VLCREHGQQLTMTSAATTKGFDGFELFGIVKETGVDDAGLTAFYKDHYPYPMYRDENLDFYNAFGSNKKITDSMSWSTILNPYAIYKGVKQMNTRMTTKKLEGNLIGEGLKTGGIIIFGNDQLPKYCYPEITGSELNIDDILAAVQDVRTNSSEPNKKGTTTTTNDEL